MEQCNLRASQPVLDGMAQEIQTLLMFMNFHNHMDFSVEQHLAITKSILELTDSSRGLGHIERRSCGQKKFEDNAKFF